jgi:hypothetical protein
MVLALAAAVLVVAVLRLLTSDRPVFEGRYVFEPFSQNSAFVTDAFTLDGRPSSVGVSLDTNLSNNWMFVNLALVNETTNVALDFGRELEYYFGVEDGESWSSGSRRGRVVVPNVPAGRYYLRVEPEGDTATRTPIVYSIEVRRDTPVWLFYGVALGLLAVPPLFISWRHHAFERRRWYESDYGGDDDDDEEDDD